MDFFYERKVCLIFIKNIIFYWAYFFLALNKFSDEITAIKCECDLLYSNITIISTYLLNKQLKVKC